MKSIFQKWIVKYTIIFILVSTLVYSLQIYYGKSFVYAEKNLTGDGLLQHYNSLAYYGGWLRDILKNFFIEHSFSIPEYDLSIGLGGDIITTFNYYVIGDPLNLSAVFVPAQYIEILYNILVILRLYLAGIAFCIYCKYHSYEFDNILPGVIIYIFSFYTIETSVLHPFFLNALIYFPLILLGIDKIFKERKPFLFIISCAVAAMCNFYFFYMMTILMFIYGCIQYIHMHIKKIKLTAIVSELGKMALYYILALMLAAPVFLPTAIVVLGSDRVGINQGSVPFLYELIYYPKLLIAFVNASAGYYSDMGYSAVGVLAVFLLFFKTKWYEKIRFKIVFILGTVFLMFPFWGHLFNGFGYVTNRWVWGYAFVVALIVVEMLPEIKKLPEIYQWLAVGATILFMIPTFWWRANGSKEKLTAAGIVIGISAIVLFVLIKILQNYKKADTGIYLVIISINAFLAMFSFYSPISGNDIQRHGNNKEAWKNITGGPLSVLEESGREFENVRIDTSNLYFSGVRANSAILHDVNSTSFYFSVVNENTNSFLHDMWIPTSYEHKYADLDSRTLLETVLGVKYNIVRSGEETYLPYGYEEKIAENDKYALYEFQDALPMAFMYDAVLDKKDYDGLTAIEKQQALLQAAVIEREDFAEEFALKEVESIELEFEDYISQYEVKEVKGMKYVPGCLEVKEAGASIILETDNSYDAERYVVFENLCYEGKGNAIICITDGLRSKKFEIKNKKDPAYAGIHDFICNIGYADKHENTYEIIFSEPGIYTYHSIEITNQPLNNLNKWNLSRKEDSINYCFEEDKGRFEVNIKNDRFMYIAIPYSDGWTAYVDEQPVEPIKVNGFGIGVYIPKGEHMVEIKYHTPYARLGIILMFVGMLGCYIIRNRLRKNNKEEKGNYF